MESQTHEEELVPKFELSGLEQVLVGPAEVEFVEVFPLRFLWKPSLEKGS